MSNIKAPICPRYYVGRPNLRSRARRIYVIVDSKTDRKYPRPDYNFTEATQTVAWLNKREAGYPFIE